VIEIGVPEWGVAALHDKAEAFAGYGANFRQLQIPAKIQGDERKETELGLKKIEADIVAPLDKQAEEMFKLCAAKAAEFHVATEFAAKCRARTKGESRPEATGQVPSPTIASQPAAKWEGTAPSVEDSGYVDYLASLVGSRDGVDKKLKEYLRKNPQNSKAVYLLGLHYQKIKRFELAQYFFNQLEKDNRFEWKSFLLNNHGLIALSDHNKELAVEYFEKATKAEPKIAAPFANLGALHLQTKNYVEAEPLFKKAVALDSELEEAALGWGVALEGQGKFEAAHEVYVDFISENSKALAVLYNDSLLLGNRLGKKEKAADQMLRYIQKGGRESAKAHESMRNWR
jgi:tetratricopeptide (TPR) repeat protein